MFAFIGCNRVICLPCAAIAAGVRLVEKNVYIKLQTISIADFPKTRNLSLFPNLLQNEQTATAEDVPEKTFSRPGTGKESRIAVTLAEEAQEALVNQKVKPKNHPGSMWINRVALPERIVSSVKLILSHENIRDIQKRAVDFDNRLHMRVLPVEEEEYRMKASIIENEVMSEVSVLEPFLNERQLEGLEHSRHQKIKKKLKQLIYHWEPINYAGSTCFEYLVSRSAAEYASLCKIFHEIFSRDPYFKPLTLCDFGSGIGSTLWASHKFWGNTLQEYLAVDTSRDMNDLSELILRGGSLANDHWLHGIFYRQFLPASSKIKYDIVVSGYSLLELPSLKKRIETIDILWKKTSNYLVLIEKGTNAGFEALIQARDYILGLHEEKRANCHVFSPCPTDTFCPRFEIDSIPCNFYVKYRPLLPFEKELTRKEVFSYIVLKRGKRNDTGWPRIIADPLIRSKHLYCRLCTKHGDLAEVVLTKRKASRELYRCGRKSHAGDLLPVNEVETLEKYDPQMHDDLNVDQVNTPDPDIISRKENDT